MRWGVNGSDIVLIANPAARRVDDQISIRELAELLSRAGLPVAVRETREKGDGERMAREAVAAGVRRVVAAGGDGTLNEVLQGLAGSETELALLPLGTGNVMAHSMGLNDRDLAACAEVAARGASHRIDVGRMNERCFMAMAGTGIDALVTENLDPWWKQKLGRLAFLSEFLRTVLQDEPRVFTVRVNGEEIVGPMWAVLISNTNEYTWRVRPSESAREDDGLLDAVFVHRTGYLDLMDLAARMFIEGDTAADHPNATVLRVSRMEITVEPPCPWQADGDVYGETPVSVEVLPHSLRLVTPG